MDNFAVLIQYLIPKQLITVIAGKFANLEAGKLTTIVIAWFVKRYKVNMLEALDPNISSYKTFNEFFTRPLKSDARPLATADFICPIDGSISQFGHIEANQIFQAKGHYYSTSALLGGDDSAAERYQDGTFACLYLSPKDYHRIHMPCAGKLLKMTYVPGALFSVNPATARGVPGLFARNERVVCKFNSKEHGDFVLVLVGATIVGSMSTVWHGIINPPRTSKIRTWSYEQENIQFQQGEEMGRFLLGSTVVMLFEKDKMKFNGIWNPAKFVQLGEMMATKI
ncbi:MAG TPA: archaetidylserine decarboxylase [Methylotenera sp.]|nr:archaetidylserine decarboxylase [Methylotenera sp.]